MSSPNEGSPPISRRDLFGGAISAAALAAAFGGPASTASAAPATAAAPSGKQYTFRKSINLWAFPYPQKLTLEQCLQLAKDAGFDGIELNYDLDNDLSPKNGTRHFESIRRLAERIGIAISGVCSFLYWPYPLTSNDSAKRTRGLELGGLMAQCAHDLGTENLLVVPGAGEVVVEGWVDKPGSYKITPA